MRNAPKFRSGKRSAQIAERIGGDFVVQFVVHFVLCYDFHIVHLETISRMKTETKIETIEVTTPVLSNEKDGRSNRPVTVKRQQTAAARSALDALRKSGKSPRQKGEERDRQALNWIYRWGWSTPTIIDHLSGAKGRGLTSRLIKNKLIIKTEVENARIPYILTLTKNGLEEALSHASRQLPYELNPTKYRNDQHYHYDLAQKITVHFLNKDGIIKFRTEKESNEISERYIKQHDIVFILKNDKRIGVEVELTGKWGRKFDEFIYSCLNALKREKIDKIFIVSTKASIVIRYYNAFSVGSHFYIWGRNDSGNYTRQEEFKIVNDQLSRIKIVHIDAKKLTETFYNLRQDDKKIEELKKKIDYDDDEDDLEIDTDLD